MQRYDRGFILLDSLMTVFIVSCICILCFSVYQSIENYIEGYRMYQDMSNQRYEDIYLSFNDCEVCITDEYVEDD